MLVVQEQHREPHALLSLGHNYSLSWLREVEGSPRRICINHLLRSSEDITGNVVG